MHEPRVPDAAPHGEAAGALVERGNALALQGRIAEAFERYSAALALQPERFEAHANLGALLLAANRPGEAETHLRAFALAPGDAKVLAAWTRLLRQCGRFVQAASACVCCAAA